MKPYFLFAVIDLMILLVYPIAFIAHHLQRLRGEKHRRKNHLDRAN
jgi:hypothetical protein